MATLAAVGSNKSLEIVAESSFGVTAATVATRYVRAKSGAKFELKRDTFTSNELRADRQVGSLTYGTRSGSGEIPFEFSYGSFDDLLEAVMGGTWSTNVLKVGNEKRSFSVVEGYPDINLFEVNTGCVFTGFSLAVKPNAMVEGSFSALFKDQTCAQYADDGVTTMVFDATGKTITRSAGSFVTDGFEVGQTVKITGASVAGNNQSILLSGVTATKLTASTATIVNDTAKTGVTICRILDADPTAVNANEVYDSFTGVIKQDSATVAIVTGIDVKFDQAGQANNVLFDATAQSITLGKVNVTGTVTVRFVNNALKKKFLSGTAVALEFTLGDGTAKSYKFEMGTAKYTSATTDAGENELTQTLNFTAIYDTSDASTLVITRIPGP
jgi:hypothetical protein